ncbi:MAG: hypothetical protein WDO16_03385 [Bacteroidota bacterium]
MRKAMAIFLFTGKKRLNYITHLKQLTDCEDLLRDFYTVCREGLKEKLGPLIIPVSA